MVEYSIEKNSEIDLESIIEAGVRDEFSELLSIIPDYQKHTIPPKKWQKKRKKEKLQKIQKKMKTKPSDIDARCLYIPCTEAFMRRLGVNKDRAHRYTALLLSGAGIIRGGVGQIYTRIRTYISRSKT